MAEKNINEKKSSPLNAKEIIKILKYGNDHPDGFTFKQIENDIVCNEKLISEMKSILYINQSKIEKIQRNHISDYFYVVKGIPLNPTKFREEAIIALNVEGYFKLLQYEEINEARDSSKKAQRTANWALILAIIVGLAQITIGILSLVNC